MNQHERVEQLMAEHDAQAERARHIVGAPAEVERCIGLLAFHIDRSFTDAEQRYELTGYLDNLRHAIAKVEADV